MTQPTEAATKPPSELAIERASTIVARVLADQNVDLVGVGEVDADAITTAIARRVLSSEALYYSESVIRPVARDAARDREFIESLGDIFGHDVTDRDTSWFQSYVDSSREIRQRLNLVRQRAQETVERAQDPMERVVALDLLNCMGTEKPVAAQSGS